MDRLVEKLTQLLKALKAPNSGEQKLALPTIPSISKPPPPSMKPNISTKMPGVAPSGKKDPRRIAAQIKNGEMSTKTQKILFKANGQWELEKESDQE